LKHLCFKYVLELSLTFGIEDLIKLFARNKNVRMLVQINSGTKMSSTKINIKKFTLLNNITYSHIYVKI